MAIELVTGYQGRDHVTADQWADFNRGIFGDAAILPVGNKMEVAIQTANKITVKDGIAVIDGRQVSIGYGESENITIKSGTQGKLRRDIVVLEYKRVEDTGVESVQFKVIDGTPATSNAQDPAVRNTDIRTGAIVSQKPFCRVRLNGTAIEGVDSLIRVKELKDMAFYEPVNNLVGTDPKMALAAPMGKELKKSIDQINTNLIDENYFVVFQGKNNVLCEAKIKNGYVTIKGGSWGDFEIPANSYHSLTTLPKKYRPNHDYHFYVAALGTPATIFGWVKSDGIIDFYSTTKTDYWAYCFTYPL